MIVRFARPWGSTNRQFGIYIALIAAAVAAWAAFQNRQDNN
jgi:predicted hotdog family 3-hydroxylacyl-ACP dehydratase